MKTFILPLLCLWTAFAARAQEAPAPPNQHVIQLNGGLSQFTVNDQNASPLTYQARLFQLGLGYIRRSSKAEWQAGIQLSYGPNFDAKAYPGRVIHYSEDLAVPMAGSLLAGHVFAHYLRRVGHFPRGTVWLGTGIQHRIQYPFEAPYAGLSMITSVPLIAKANYILSAKTRLSSQIGYSLVGLVTRLPWHNTYSLPEVGSQFNALYQNDTQLAGGHRLRQLSWNLAVSHAMSRRTTLGLTYQFDLLRYPGPRPLASWSNSLQLSSSFTF